MKARAADAEHKENVKLADAYWSAKAKEKDWDCVRADLSVYKYSGKGVPEQDPRRTEEYRKKGPGWIGTWRRPDQARSDGDGNEGVQRSAGKESGSVLARRRSQDSPAVPAA